MVLGVSCKWFKWVGVVLTIGLLGCASPVRAGEYIYTGCQAATHNGALGFGEFLAYANDPSGAPSSLCDNNVFTGVWYPFTPNVYGNSVAGAWGMRPFFNGEIPDGEEPTLVELHVKVWCSVPTGNQLQAFVLRVPTEMDFQGWGFLSWSSMPWFQTPAAPPFLPNAWNQGQWVEIVARFPWTGLGLPWDRAAIFNNAYGIWVKPPVPGSGIFLGEWWLRVVTQ